MDRHMLNEVAKPLAERKGAVDSLVMAGRCYFGLNSEEDCRGTPCKSCTAHEPENGDEYVNVVCLVLPTGENLWFEAEKGQDYMRKVIDKWKAEHPEFADTPCNMGAVHITMPREKYNAIGAHFGPGCFVWL